MTSAVDDQPLITPRGVSRAILRASPARCTTSTPPWTSIQAWGLSRQLRIARRAHNDITGRQLAGDMVALGVSELAWGLKGLGMSSERSSNR